MKENGRSAHIHRFNRVLVKRNYKCVSIVTPVLPFNIIYDMRNCSTQKCCPKKKQQQMKLFWNWFLWLNRRAWFVCLSIDLFMEAKSFQINVASVDRFVVPHTHPFFLTLDWRRLEFTRFVFMPLKLASAIKSQLLSFFFCFSLILFCFLVDSIPYANMLMANSSVSIPLYSSIVRSKQKPIALFASPLCFVFVFVICFASIRNYHSQRVICRGFHCDSSIDTKQKSIWNWISSAVIKETKRIQFTVSRIL